MAALLVACAPTVPTLDDDVRDADPVPVDDTPGTDHVHVDDAPDADPVPLDDGIPTIVDAAVEHDSVVVTDVATFDQGPPRVDVNDVVTFDQGPPRVDVNDVVTFDQGPPRVDVAPFDQGPPDQAPGPRDVVSDWCATRSDGMYCDGPSLRTCAARMTVRITPCADGCYDRGAGSACASDAVDPCFNDPDGSYCGASIGAVLRQGDLWVCRARRTERIESCSMGCEGAAGSARCRVAVSTDPCERATAGDGAYCGASLMAGDAQTLYRCVARRTASSMVCAHGCAVRPPGTPDVCNPSPMTAAGYRLPFACGARVRVSQGNNSGFSHVGEQAWAYDFGVGRGTPVMAMEAGSVTHVSNMVTPGGRCWNGGGSECANTVNYVVIAHDDGMSTLYLHLDAAEVAVGARVTRGQRIARSGNTGWSTGAHLHVQRQARCASWFCGSRTLTFADVGMPVFDATVTSGNCP